MDQDFAAFLASHVPFDKQRMTWGDMQLEATSYLCADLPPLSLITSVRSVVLHKGQVLVVRDPTSHHLLPGGRVEADESLLDTLRRELLEETGWTVERIHLLGVKHFHHLTPIPPRYAYPYPDFLQVIYRSQAVEFHAEARQHDEYVVETTFHAPEQIKAITLAESDRVYLEAALRGMTDHG